MSPLEFAGSSLLLGALFYFGYFRSRNWSDRATSTSSSGKALRVDSSDGKAGQVSCVRILQPPVDWEQEPWGLT